MDNRQNSTNINWYPGHMAKTKRLISENIDKVDLIYEIIDSRMPYSSKVRDIDNIIKNKPRILIMTKMDLCDKVETDKWIKYYQKKGYKVISVDLAHNTNLKPIFNATNEIMNYINQKRISKGMIARSARVLVMGIPNVGKSTLINRLVDRKAVNVGNRPGITKNLSWIRINTNIELLDTPGILWPKLEEKTVAYNLASLTAIKEEILPIFSVVEYILNTLYNYYPDILKKRYDMDSVDSDIAVNLEKIGKIRGCLCKGGDIDYEKAAYVILNDLKEGNIKGITFDRIKEYEL
ncbi:MAG: ribosome biogenesis GTPase YlqF [Clostridium sp.]|nr:ribosome biogenesis GTPase YlqF [Clostridium sp.]MCM1444681.1 ribosome biogenesis GTPase YlqF [Candidatus Amulumruptor caecigallinarius]